MNQVKDFLEYIFNAFKIWIIIQPWEHGLRVRSGKYITKLTCGIYFRIPYLDSVFIQSVRMRSVSLPVQTLTSKDLKTITLNSSLGYKITDVEKLYNSIYHPELTLSNIAMSEMAEFVYKHNIDEINPSLIEKAVINKMQEINFGMEIDHFRIQNFAVVKTYRLIQDHSWSSEGNDLDLKK